MTWEKAFGGPISVPFPLERNSASDRDAFAKLVRAYLFVGDVRPRIVWDSNEAMPGLELGGGLFGALALQLMQWSAASQGIYFCRNCGRTYAPRRRAKPGEATFCGRKECQLKRKAMNVRAFRKANR